MGAAAEAKTQKRPGGRGGRAGGTDQKLLRRGTRERGLGRAEEKVMIKVLPSEIFFVIITITITI